MKGFGEESSHGDSDERSYDTTGRVASVSLALAVYHLDCFRAGTLDALVAALDGAATHDTRVTLDCLLLFAAHGGVLEFRPPVPVCIVRTVHEELLQLGVIVAVLALVVLVGITYIARQGRS